MEVKKNIGMDVNDVNEMRRLPDDNAKLMCLVAEQAIDIVMLNNINS